MPVVEYPGRVKNREGANASGMRHDDRGGVPRANKSVRACTKAHRYIPLSQLKCDSRQTGRAV